MNTPSLRLTALAASLVLLALPAYALTVRRVDVKIPFAFTAGSASLPAGHYRLQRNGATNVLVRDADGVVVATVLAGPLDSAAFGGTKVEVVFNRYGSDHFLAEIRASGYGMGLSLQKSKAEREIAARQKRYTVAVDANIEP